MNNFHTPVLLKEIIENLKVKKDSKYIDATIGGAGHSFAILERGGKVLGIDVDQDALDYVQKKIRNIGELTLVKGNFREIDKIAHSKNFDKVAGILFDLGVSSYQLEEASRGFSFQKEGPLDMRMGRDLTVSAADLIHGLTEKELYELFTKLGEENNAWKLSRLIVRSRQIKKIGTTSDLAEIIQKGLGRKVSGIHSATKTFQALRIAVNDELNSLREALPKAVRLLEKGGRLLIISFHSLEDRIVKRSFIEFEKNNLGKVITQKPIVPCKEEVRRNRRARSAKLRIFSAKD